MCFVLSTQDEDVDSPILTSCDIVKVPDPQMGMVREIKSLLIKSSERRCDLFMLSLKENLVESKHHKLARSLRSGPSDHDLKPNAATRDQLNVSDKRAVGPDGPVTHMLHKHPP